MNAYTATLTAKTGDMVTYSLTHAVEGHERTIEWRGNKRSIERVGSTVEGNIANAIEQDRNTVLRYISEGWTGEAKA